MIFIESFYLHDLHAEGPELLTRYLNQTQNELINVCESLLTTKKTANQKIKKITTIMNKTGTANALSTHNQVALNNNEKIHHFLFVRVCLL